MQQNNLDRLKPLAGALDRIFFVDRVARRAILILERGY